MAEKDERLVESADQVFSDLKKAIDDLHTVFDYYDEQIKYNGEYVKTIDALASEIMDKDKEIERLRKEKKELCEAITWLKRVAGWIT